MRTYKMRNFLNLETIKRHVISMKTFAERVHGVQDISAIANIMDEWSPIPDTDKYMTSDDDVKDDTLLYMLHMRRGTMYQVVLETEDGLVQLVDINTWHDMLKPHIKFMIKTLSNIKLEDIKIQLISWSPIEEPRISFNMILSFIGGVTVDRILGVKIDSENCEQLIPQLEYYISFLKSVEFD